MAEWPTQPKVLGTRVPRVDGPAKVSGQARYSSDIQLPGLLIGMILRSRWPAARILRINLDKARKMPGIKAAVAVQEGPRIVRFYGEELAAVAGVSREACEDALRVIEVEAEPLPFVVREEDAKKPDAPRVWEQAPNMPPPRVQETGNVDAAWAECAAIVEGFYTTSVQLHHPMEPHGGTAHWTEEGLTAWISTQGIASVRDGLAGALRLEQSKVRVITEYMGGGFGSKFGPGVEGILAARLSREAGAPVRLMLSRFEESLAVGNRPSSFQRIKLGAKADGTLHVFDYENYGTAGIGAGQATEGGGGGADLPMPYIYQVPNRRIKQTAVAVNAGSARPFRAPGHPVASFGMESAMDELAVKLGMDPLELRIKNDPFEIRRREYKIGAERFGWKEKYRKPGTSPGPVKVGVGVASATWGGGGSRNTRGEVQINPDGTVEVRLGVQDIGTGTRTVAAVVAAEVLGLKPEQIHVKIGDTLYPLGPGSGGSVTAPSVAPTVFDVCTRALEELQKQTGVSDARGDNWKTACKKLGVNPLTVQGRWREGLSSSGVGGVQFAEVAVDTETGLVTVKKILVVQDCGLVVDPLTAESQVNGGVIMGIGMALYEERVMDWQTGLVLNPNYETYKLPSIADVPEIDIILLNMPERGVIGLGEPVHIPTAAAIANAVANAIGVRVPSLPITPRKVLTALGQVPVRRSSAT
ncbi:MAG: xanthine dehydrogenase family protein molybdopterin-binding subunit [Verrucomicrobiota bacterium]|nr:xanthine dehydrogenase family protein molybdopterin-binding subunit [Limisphaera sp.]MDW8381743.1 xanthine dehydrogenase family protein molybdopterin-binding subunit [Verrucomicrobiota bacterium]